MDIFRNMSESNYFYLFALAVILLSTKIFGLASRRIHMPAVAGALAAGIILGPSGLGILKETDFLKKTAELGVIILMFRSGLETDLRELKKRGSASFIIAVTGVALPLLGGALLYYYFAPEGVKNTDIIKALFIGVTLTATSVSITVETLREMGRLKGPVGTVILGAAIIDDITGIIVLTAITTINEGNGTSLVMVIIRIMLFFIFVFLTGLMAIVGKLIAEEVNYRRRAVLYAIAFCFAMSFCAEEFFGVADITGAYFAGIVLCCFGMNSYIDSHIDIMGYLFFTPVFFACIGLRTDLRELAVHPSIIWFALALFAVAVVTKIAGCGSSAMLCGFDKKEALAIGAGMVSRGEVALIVAQKGFSCGLLEPIMFSAVVFTVIATTLITPVMLKAALERSC